MYQNYITLIKRFIFYACFVVALATAFSWRDSAPASESLSSAGKILLAKYPAIKTALEKNQYGIPLYLESKEECRIDFFPELF